MKLKVLITNRQTGKSERWIVEAASFEVLAGGEISKPVPDRAADISAIFQFELVEIDQERDWRPIFHN